MKTHLVSIILPLYNSETTIVETLKSVLIQTYTHWECIIVDDGSTDASYSVVTNFIKNDIRFQLVKRHNKHKPGANGARNYGFDISKGYFVNWIDSDDTLHPDFILEKINAFEKNIDVVISKTIQTDQNNVFLQKETRTVVTKNLIEDFITLKVSWYISDPMWKRHFLIEVNEFFNEELLKGQDRDFHIRILNQNPIIKIIDKYLYFYKTNPNSISTLNSSEVEMTILKESLKRNKIILRNKIHNKTKLFLLKQQLRTYSALYMKPNVFMLYKQVFKDLFVFDYKNVIVLIKFITSIFSFKLFKKGDKILSSM